jgi:hypothetical protein
VTAHHPAPDAEFPVRLEGPIDLAAACAPVAWAGGRWPNEAWIGGRFWWVGHEAGGPVVRSVAPGPDGALLVRGGDEAAAAAWARRVLIPAQLPAASGDGVVASIAARTPRFASLCYGSLFEGAVVSVVGQSISVAAAAITATRMSAIFHRGVEAVGRTLWPLPTPAQLAGADPALVRASGVTMRRAETLVLLGREFAVGAIADRPGSDAETAAAGEHLLALPGVGPWTVASALLWGLGHPDAFPTGDAALLRAARRAYADPGMDHRALARMADGWRPYRAVAARLLWLDLFGPAPREEGVG